MAMTASMTNAIGHQEQVRSRTGQRGQVVVADDLAEVAGDDRGGLGPAHQQCR